MICLFLVYVFLLLFFFSCSLVVLFACLSLLLALAFVLVSGKAAAADTCPLPPNSVSFEPAFVRLLSPSSFFHSFFHSFILSFLFESFHIKLLVQLVTDRRGVVVVGCVH